MASHRAAAAVLIAAGACAAQPIDAFWIGSSFGEWEQPERWTTNPFIPLNGQPNPRDAYHVFIDDVGDGDPYIVQLDGTIPFLTVESITLNAPNATLHIVGTDVDMQGGQISVMQGVLKPDSVAIRNAVIQVNGGEIEFDEADPMLLDGVTLVGEPFIADGVVEFVNGLTIDGVWALDNSYHTILELNGDQTVNGGELNFSPVDVQEWYVFITDGSTVTLSPTTSIIGGADKGLQLGRNKDAQVADNTLINQGVIHANAENNRIEIWSQNFVNEGLMEISDFGVLSLSWIGEPFYIDGMDIDAAWTNSGTLRLSLGTLNLGGSFTTADLGSFERVFGFIKLYGVMDNTGETFDATQAGTPLIVDHGEIIGGVVEVAPDGFIMGPEATFEGVEFVGDIHTNQNASQIILRDSVVLGDELIVEHQQVQVVLEMASLDAGAIRWDSLGSAGTVFAAGVDGEFTLGADAALTGYNFHISSKAHVTNQGLIEATNCQETNVGATCQNEGVVRATVCADINFFEHLAIDNFVGDSLVGGAWEVVEQGRINFFGRSIVTNDAMILRDGTGAQIPALADLAINLGQFTLLGGADQNTPGDFDNAGVLHLGDGSIVNVAGALTLDPSGAFETVMSTSQSGMIIATGPAQLGGSLDADLADGYAPMIGEVLTVLSAASITGEFETVTLPDPPPGLRFVYTQDEDSVDVVVTCAGDFNGDGVLNIIDFVDYQNAFVSGDADADCNGDGSLNILDFVCFQNAFGKGC